MTRYPCSGCGLHSCDGRCFTECAADYPETDPCLADARRIVAERQQLTECRGDPLLKAKRRRAA